MKRVSNALATLAFELQYGPRVILVHQFPFRIGRSADCHLREDLTTVSFHHCQIVENHGVISVEDIGSAIGTYLNGVRINEPCQLKSNDIIEFGSTWMLMGVREDFRWSRTKH